MSLIKKKKESVHKQDLLGKFRHSYYTITIFFMLSMSVNSFIANVYCLPVYPGF